MNLDHGICKTTTKFIKNNKLENLTPTAKQHQIQKKNMQMMLKQPNQLVSYNNKHEIKIKLI